MITILAEKLTDCVTYLQKSTKALGVSTTVVLCDGSNLRANLKSSLTTSKVLVCIGNTLKIKNAFCSVFSVPLLYDKVIEKCFGDYCKAAKLAAQPQYVLDKVCVKPENFLVFQSASQETSCRGEFKGRAVYILPDSESETIRIAENFLFPEVKSLYQVENCFTFKMFGLTENAIKEKFEKDFPSVSQKCETFCLDSLVTVCGDKKLTPKVVGEIKSAFSAYIYATENVSLEIALVTRLMQMQQCVAVAESLTGGMISDLIVSVPGASKVFFEGLCTYTVESKCNRLGVNPHLVDEKGVVSQEVATEMAKGLLRDVNVDYALSTTGFAGPTAEYGRVGLCYVGVGDKLGVSAYKFVFSGNRYEIRRQAANTAMWALLKKIQTA